MTPTTPAKDTADFTFSGDNELELMELARNYNACLLRWVCQDLKPGQRVLDFGAGTGRYCNKLLDMGHSVAAVELDKRYHRSLRCEVATTVDSLPNPFDLLYSINVLEHIQDDAASVRQLHAALKPGARTKIFVPALPMLFTKMDQRVGHFRRYTRQSLTTLFTSNGFTVTRCHYFDLLGFFATLAYKPFGDGSFSPRSLQLYDSLAFPLSHALDRLTLGRLIGKNLQLEAIRI